MTYYLDLLSFGPEGWGDELAQGALITIALAVLTLPFGLMLGLLVALGQRSGSRLARNTAVVFTTVFRGLPELLTLFIVYYGGQLLLQKLAAALGYGAPIQVNSFLAGFVALGLVLAAFSSEVWMGALNAIPNGQREAARALGLSARLSFRLVVLPQLVRLALPGLGNNWLVLLKDTSLVSTIALADLMRQTNIAVGSTKEPLFFYLVACLVYLFFSMVSGGALGWLEARTSRGQVRRPA